KKHCSRTKHELIEIQIYKTIARNQSNIRSQKPSKRKTTASPPGTGPCIFGKPSIAQSQRIGKDY
ncbi:MAG: hypothetical protein Q4A54_11870, partial [Parabacteroides sp.]|nr:hypothetical protein [Parabacteroides sp.]